MEFAVTDALAELLTEPAADATAIHAVTPAGLPAVLADLGAAAAAWAEAQDFTAKPGTHLVVPGDDGGIAAVLAGVSEPVSVWDMGTLATALPPRTYTLTGLDASAAETLTLGWLLGGYAFDGYKENGGNRTLASVSAEGVDASAVCARADATALVRDLINTPANDMGPTALAAAAKGLAQRFGADYAEVVGDDLLKRNYPAVHAVGRAAADAPRIVELTWGDPSKPTVALVGKGVCFDSGGLDIKPAAGMKLMKKDMGGAAHVLGAAHILMAMGLDAHLKVLVPAVENAIAGNAMRPLDVVQTRAGVTVEIGNTDAEGRVILADALARAVECEAETIVDFATLTGAARIALGTELPALFCNDDSFCSDIIAEATQIEDPLWRMPLWQPYAKLIEGKVADITNSPDGGYGGAITAALFLQRFVPDTVKWAHIDVMAWNLGTKPGRPEGGEAMGMRAIATALLAKYRRI